MKAEEKNINFKLINGVSKTLIHSIEEITNFYWIIFTFSSKFSLQ